MTGENTVNENICFTGPVVGEKIEKVDENYGVSPQRVLYMRRVSVTKITWSVSEQCALIGFPIVRSFVNIKK